MSPIISHFKVAEGLDILPLQRAVLRQPWLFGKHPERQYASDTPHSEMTDIWLRYNSVQKYLRRGSFAGFNDEHDSQWYPEYYALPQVREIIFKLMELAEGERLGGVLITKLPPHGKIDVHQDFGWHASYYDKYYVPLTANEGERFVFPDGEIRPKLGEAYWFENSLPHAVFNDSDSDRLALIVCIRSDSTKGAFRPQLEKPAPVPVHHFSAGLYAREMRFPAGFGSTSHKHHYDHMSILASGEVTLYSGEEVHHYVAPAVIAVKAGIEHKIIAIEDSVWFCLHPHRGEDEVIDDQHSVLIEHPEETP